MDILFYTLGFLALCLYCSILAGLEAEWKETLFVGGVLVVLSGGFPQLEMFTFTVACCIGPAVIYLYTGGAARIVLMSLLFLAGGAALYLTGYHPEALLFTMNLPIFAIPAGIFLLLVCTALFIIALVVLACVVVAWFSVVLAKELLWSGSKTPPTFLVA